MEKLNQAMHLIRGEAMYSISAELAEAYRLLEEHKEALNRPKERTANTILGEREAPDYEY